MKIKIHNQAILSDYTPAEQATIKKYLTINNPMFNMKLERGLSLWGIDKQLKYYTESGRYLFVSVGALPGLMPALKQEHNSIFEVTDNRFSLGQNLGYFNKYSFNVLPYDYQVSAIDAFSNTQKTVGILQSKTGSGKTVMMLGIVFNLKENTLILVHTKELMNQTIDAIVNMTTIPRDEIGIIGDGKKVIKPITVAMQQTLANYDNTEFDELNNFFSVIFADEVHICAADTYYRNINSLTAKYRFGLSATPYRDDGYTEVVYFATGPVVHIVPDEAVKSRLIHPTIREIETNYYFPLFDSSEYQDLITHLSADIPRNNFILSVLEDDYKNNYVCFLCTRKEQVNYFAEKLGDSAISLTSDLPKKERKRRMELLKAKKVKHVISTYALFSTGIDVPHLDVLFMCAPIKASIKLKQSAGRLMRQAPGKTKAVIVDFVDKQVGILKTQYYKRRKIMRSL